MGQIGRLGLAVVGSYFGGPLGFALGTIAGGILFPERTRLPDQEGPRLGDAQMTNSSYGIGIPKIWGTYRVTGNIIWAGPVNEIKRSNTQKIRQGKGGGSSTTQTTHEFFYHQSFALALCEGEAKRVTKIFFDGEVVYDITSTAGSTTVEGLRFRFYPGDEAQLPDSIIESYEGSGNVPAHRGLSYLVFDELDITNYRRIPTIEVQVQMVGNDTILDRSIGGLIPGYRAVNLQSRTLINWSVYDEKQLADIDKLETFRTTQVTYMGNAQPLGPAPGGDFLVGNSTIKNDSRIYLVDSSTLQPKGAVSVPMYPQFYKGKYAVFPYVGALGKEHLIFIGDQRIKVVVPTNQPSAGDFYNNATVSFPWGPTGWRCYRFCYAYQDKCYIIMTLPGTADRFAVFETALVDNIIADPISGEIKLDIIVTASMCAQFTTLDIDPNGLIPNFWGPWGGLGDRNDRNIDGMIYDPSDDSLLVSFGLHLVTVKINCSDWSVKWRFVSEPGGTIPALSSFSYDLAYGHDISIGTWLVARGPQGVGGYLLDLSTGTPIKTIPASVSIGEYRYWVYDSKNKAAYSENYNRVLYFDRPPSDRVPVSHILEGLREEIGAVEADYSEILEYQVDGYARMSPTTSRSMIEPLASVFGFDGVDAGTHLRWIKRGGDSIVDVDRDDLLAGTGEVVDFTRTQEVELPRLVTITYADLTRDFEQSTYHASRYYGNEQYTTQRSSNQIAIEAPMAVTATEVKQRADSMMREAWNSRDAAKFSAPRYFLEHEVGDVVTLLVPGRVPQDMRLDGFTVGSNLAIDITATAQDSSQYTSTVQAERGQGFVEQFILTPRDLLTRLFMLPVPLLLDSSDRARQELLVQYAMGAVSPNWKSGVLEHDDGSGFTAVGSVQTDAVHGALIGSLPVANPDVVFATDETLTIRVAIAVGTLESVTQEQMLAGANAAAIIHNSSRAEVIQFRNAELGEDGTYTLSGILRGRRGTDSWALTYQAPSGATFVELTPDAVSATTAPLSELGHSRLYRGHEIRQDPVLGDSRSAELLGIEMMPYAPVQVEYTGNLGDDISMTWERRTRLRGGLADNTPEVPLNEDTENYEVDVVIGGAVVRTITSAMPVAVYTQAQQVEDGATSANAFVQIFVYQMSTQVGRGFPSLPITLGAASEVAQFAPLVITNVPPPTIEVGQHNMLMVQPTEPSVIVAQLGVLIFGPPPVNNEDDGRVAQHNQLIISDILPSEWQGGQFNQLVIQEA